jgi:excisionase family DNA binding protein
METMLRVRQFAETLGVGKSTVRLWLKVGYLQGVRTRGMWLIPSSEVIRILNENTNRQAVRERGGGAERQN